MDDFPASVTIENQNYDITGNYLFGERDFDIS